MPLAPVGAAAPPAAPTAVSSRTPFPNAMAPRPAAQPSPPPPARGHGALAALDGVAQAQRRLDAVLEAARAGRTFTAGELIGLQAQAYRYAQTVDLASKIVEQGAQAVRQATNTQL